MLLKMIRFTCWGEGMIVHRIYTLNNITRSFEAMANLSWRILVTGINTNPPSLRVCFRLGLNSSELIKKL
jgi:hypothetical protein